MIGNPSPKSRVVALIWLAAGIAFMVAGVLADRRQAAFFAVATLFAAVSAITSRRARAGRPSSPTRS